MSHGHNHLPEGRPFSYPGGQKGLHLALIAIGLVLTVVGFAHDAHRAWKTVLLGYMLVTLFGLGAAFVQAVQYVANAAWGVGFRRVPEAMVNILPVSLILYVPLVLIGGGNIWAWMDPESLTPAQLHFLHLKTWYLNLPGFMIRDLVFLGAITLFSQLFRKWSLAQDKDGDEKYTWKALRLGAGFLVLWAPGISMFAFDMLMSLDHAWFSSMFGVYVFVGSFQSSLAVITLFTLWHSRKDGSLEGVVGKNNIHDLGKFLFGLSIFWAYIGFGQMLIIWYANLPEETVWFKHRWGQGWTDGWTPVSLGLILVHFVIPFLYLMRRQIKRNPVTLAIGAGWLIFAQVYDLYWLIIPTLKLDGTQGPMPFIGDIGPALAYVGVFLFIVQTTISRNKTVPVQDPRYDEFVHLHQ